MNEELDNDLKRRISEVFDNYEDPTADEGWMLLREKFPPAAKHRGVARLWWTSAAAVILLCLGIGLWLNHTTNNKQEQLAQNTIKTKQQPATTKVEVTRPKNDTQQQDINIIPPASAAKVPVTDYAVSNFKPSVQLGKRRYNENQIIPKQEIDVTAPVTNNANIPVVTPNIQPTEPIIAVVPPVDTQAPLIADNKQPAVTGKSAVTENKPVVQQKAEPQNALLAMLEKDSQTGSKTVKAGDDKTVNLGVYAATYVNYAKGSDNRVNVGAGVSSDFRITKNLKLSTGIAIAQNSFNYNMGTNVPQAAVEQSLALTTMAEDKKMFSGLLVSPTLQNYNANLIGLDIPVNLKYEFSPDKNDTYISAGLSSGTFINESYNYRYGYSGAAASSSQPINEKISEGFGNFYLARTLNVAFGIGYPLGKNNRLVIEPFVKYPLDGMGAQQIKFGSGGVNLKLNFQTRKK